MSKKYENLFRPIKIGEITVKNRIVRAPATTAYSTEDGFCTERLDAYYESLARGGVGLIMMEGSAVQEWREEAFHLCGMWSDEHIPGFKKMVDKVHKYDSKIFAQFCPMGPVNWLDPLGASTLTEEEMPWPSSVSAPPREVTLEELEKLKEDMVDAALRVKKCGFDGLEIHCAHSYFFQTFLSRTWNKRTDKYGSQSLENRARLPIEIIQEVKEACGSDFPVGIRLNGQEYGADERYQMTSEEAVELAKLFEAAGVAYISVSGEGLSPRGDSTSVPSQHQTDYWTYPEPDANMKPYVDRFNEGLFIASAEAINKAVEIPVIGVGNQDEDMAEELLQKNKVDLVAFARALFADPEFPNKLAEGRYDDIVRCNRCGTCESPLAEPRRCRVNPALGRYDYEILPADRKKKVLVVGGGPAGMEAARVAAMRGHEVLLYEKNSRLGGRLPLAAMVKGTELDNVLPVMEYLTTQVKKLPIKVKTGKKVNIELIRNMKPDVVVLATGGKYVIPDIPGKDHGIVTDVNALSKMADIPLKLVGPKALNTISNMTLPGIGKKVIIIGGQNAGLQGAVFMRKRGKEVTILESQETIGKGMVEIYFRRMIPWFAKKNVQILSGVKYEEIASNGVFITTKDGEKRLIEGDTVIMLPSQSPDEELKNELEGLVSEIYMAGSCNGEERDLIEHALADGRRIGVSI